MQSFFKNIMYSGIKDRLSSEDQVKLLFVNSTIFFGLTVLGVFWIRDFLDGQILVGAVTLGTSLVIVGLFFAIRISKSALLGAWFLPFLMFGFYTYLTATGGSEVTGVLWGLTYPVIVLFMVGPVWGSVFAATFFAAHLILFFVPNLSPVAAMSVEFKMRLLGVYIILFTFSMAFETIRKSTQAQLSATAAELAAAKVQTDGILTNVTEGIFLLDKDLTIGDQYSHSLTGLLGLESVSGRTLLDGLAGRIGDRELAAAKDYLEMYFLPDPPWHLMEEINPLSELSLATPDGNVRHLTFSFGRVELTTGRKVLGTVRDVTQAFELNKKLKEEEDRSARQMRHLFQIIHVKPELLLQFLQDADAEITSVNRRLKDPKVDPATLVEELFQGVHAVKGNAALVGLSAFANKVHDLETMVAQFRGKRPVWQDFLEMTVQLSIIQAELTEIRDLLDRMAAFQKGLEASGGATSQDLLVMALEKAVDKLSEESGLNVELDTAQFEAERVPEQHRKLVKDVLVQLLRNSYAHGLEPAHERKTLGKPLRPRIKVSSTLSRSGLQLSYWDDGRGFDLEKLKNAAQNHPSWKGRDPSSLSDAEALELAYLPGLSTADKAGLHAGRGVGLNLVKERIEASGGRLKLRSVPGKGVAFDINLPVA